MSVAATFKTYEAQGDAEDFHNAIYDISPTGFSVR